ncbi:DUF3422 family protein [Pelagibacterium xiamenense]|uniref:DUF3422 family protein n=1 Tax=Pelagibacterium xiamenense TaxID=2901140 RepID=UPI001E542BE2|nr:DUF3422 domain-containing protein [Pelagibacterium xiamenense]
MGTPYPDLHPDRDAALSELHARPLQLVDAGIRVRRIVLAVAPVAGAMQAAIERFRDFAAPLGIDCGHHGARQYSFETEERHVTWEFHTEFITVTWRASLADNENWPDDVGLDALGGARLVGATRVDLIEAATLPGPLLATFRPESLCAAAVEAGKAQVATDFVPDADGFTRFEFASGGLSAFRRSITLRRLLEIETYRTMALLALPLARTTAPSLRAVETDLAGLIEGLSDATTPEQIQERLAGLHALSVRSGQISEKLGYRFAAAEAYGEILRMRLAKLREVALGQGSSLTTFIGNRVEPALATCEALNKRIAVLSAKIERGIELLNLRIGLDMQIQNTKVLETIAETAKSQFRLQRTVEGLSTIAITYYLLGIIGYALAGPLSMLDWDKTLTLSIAAPFALLGVWLAMRAIRKKAH